ncbi:hypothetical protein GOP47_0013084 [Adiantum capillus-veneris]|uniref:non-specific serine/threonine protein kinase n=1 Tax=Adiantum capillus-veneris TaxID=13818 RepID=A0A9D4UTA4_ADICA|nr:hypothetical protein GOP47_0013084 [Adiantum capillus-veneris]
MSSPPTAPPPPSSSIPTFGLVGIAAAGVVAVTVVLTLLICLCCCSGKKKRRPSPPRYADGYYGANNWNSPAQTDALVKPRPSPPFFSPMPSPQLGSDPSILKVNGVSPSFGSSKIYFTYDELVIATGGFAKSNLLGEGGFGSVYKGTLSGGQLVAVKQLKVGGEQGDREFRAEMEVITRVHHRHLVSLVGYCLSGSQRLLVYDYVPNGNLDHHLHGKGRAILDWPTRMKIAIGAARGLAYLHEDCNPKIIHRDIKSSNILLDKNFNAQVSDFGLAKLTSDIKTHVTTRVVGTFGYLAPEYASSGMLTEKSDVFSYGVVLLELVSGRKPVDPTQSCGEESLVEWARPLLLRMNREDDLELMADPFLNGAYDQKEMLRVVAAAAACVRHSAAKRPRMGQVLRALEDDVALSDLNQGVKPGHSYVYGFSFASTDYDSSYYSANTRMYSQATFGSRDCSSEYSGGTSEHAMNPSTSSSSEY